MAEKKGQKMKETESETEWIKEQEKDNDKEYATEIQWQKKMLLAFITARFWNSPPAYVTATAEILQSFRDIYTSYV